MNDHLSIKKYQDKGLSGLTNLGNTCFINSCLSVLSHTYELNNFLDTDKYKRLLSKKNPDTLLLMEWDNLRKLIWTENCIISPNKFINVVQQVAKIKNMEIFTGYAQNDIAEFFIFMIDSFHTALSREIIMNISGNVENEKDKMAVKCFEKIKNMYSNDYSEIWNLFSAIQLTQIISLETQSVLNTIPEPFFTINLPIPSKNKNPSLQDCFNLYVEEERLENDNAWFNEETNKKENVKKEIKFWSLPTIMAIDIKRFNNNNRKNQILVTFPMDNLDLSKYVIGYKSESYIYDLYAVCNHTGSVMGGHYTSYVKNANNKWYVFNDTQVKEVKNIDEIVSPKAYCLFYRKKQP
jgi:ubiquitin C-terminal hydrolase